MFTIYDWKALETFHLSTCTGNKTTCNLHYTFPNCFQKPFLHQKYNSCYSHNNAKTNVHPLILLSPTNQFSFLWKILLLYILYHSKSDVSTVLRHGVPVQAAVFNYKLLFQTKPKNICRNSSIVNDLQLLLLICIIGLLPQAF